MPPRKAKLPEGTDHIISGAMETDAGPNASQGAGGGTGREINEGPSASPGGASRKNVNGGGNDSGADMKRHLREGVQSIKSQAGDRVRSYAEDAKDRATSTLDDLAEIIGETAESLNERLGEDYGRYARRAADAVSGYADKLRTRDVEDLFDDARDLVRKSPAVAIGTAAIVGFVLVRLVKAGLEAGDRGSDDGNAGA